MKTDCFQLVPDLVGNQVETVRQHMRNLKGVFSVQVDGNWATIMIQHTPTLSRRALAGELLRLGCLRAPGPYPGVDESV
ncbi:hypothetical protein [Spirosoma spitsbergense]|uniref:hypothetical protein n=1 Tax=Spirosoma spitsbergense TaxID=431554 RepID=UPI00037B6AF2|nr:hypothetical protein [Spirosoma spitsbergense]